MKKMLYLLLVAASLVLAACQAAEPVATETAVNETATPTEVTTEPEPTQTTAPELTAVEADENVTEKAAVTAPVELVSECTLVSALPEPPAGYAEIFAVSETDWVVGPEDAAITLIEYGDFQ